MCLVVMDVGMLGLVYRGVGAGTVSPGVYVHNISLAALTGEPDLGFLCRWLRVIVCGWWKWM